MRIDSRAVGRRVSVRYGLPDGSASDVVGRVIEAGTRLRLERRDGTVATLDPATVMIWRVVPDRPVRSRRPTAVPVDQLTRIMTRGWPPLETAPLGAWELRAAAGFTKRANSAAATAEPGLPLAEALAGVTEFYTARGLPPTVQVTGGTDLDARIRDAGWAVVPGGDAEVLVTQLDRRWARDGAAELASSADEAWWDAYGPTASPAEAARSVLEAPGSVAFARLGGAICRVVVTGEWAGFAALWVPPAQRRSGVAMRLMTTCLDWAVEQGADKGYLQVEADDEAALALYQRLGFVEHHAYRYLRLTGDPQAAAGD